MEEASAASAVKGFAPVLNRIEAPKRLSMTYDQGREMVGRQQLAAETGIKVDFADPHSPWQRGRNKNQRTDTPVPTKGSDWACSYRWNRMQLRGN